MVQTRRLRPRVVGPRGRTRPRSSVEVVIALFVISCPSGSSHSLWEWHALFPLPRTMAALTVPSCLSSLKAQVRSVLPWVFPQPHLLAGMGTPPLSFQSPWSRPLWWVSHTPLWDMMSSLPYLTSFSKIWVKSHLFFYFCCHVRHLVGAPRWPLRAVNEWVKEQIARR